jgi:hypothetical protein
MAEEQKTDVQVDPPIGIGGHGSDPEAVAEGLRA